MQGQSAFWGQACVSKSNGALHASSMPLQVLTVQQVPLAWNDGALFWCNLSKWQRHQRW